MSIEGEKVLNEKIDWQNKTISALKAKAEALDFLEENKHFQVYFFELNKNWVVWHQLEAEYSAYYGKTIVEAVKAAMEAQGKV